MSNAVVGEKLRNKVADHIVVLLNDQIAQLELFHKDEQFGLKITSLPEILTIETLLPLGSKAVKAASFGIAKQAIDFLVEAEPNFDPQFAVKYEKDVIYITKREEVARHALQFLESV